MTTKVRFAPSPTGRLHIGNIRTAVLNVLLTRKAGGSFLLRLDDTDRERSTEAFAESIRQDLTWLGLTWDTEEKQSARTARYDVVADQLRSCRPPLCLLRDRRRTGPQAQTPARPRPAPDL